MKYGAAQARSAIVTSMVRRCTILLENKHVSGNATDGRQQLISSRHHRLWLLATQTPGPPVQPSFYIASQTISDLLKVCFQATLNLVLECQSDFAFSTSK